jgi:hypothetical protein
MTFSLCVAVVSSRFRQGKPIVTLKLIDIGSEEQIDFNKLKSRLKPFVDSKYDFPVSCSVVVLLNFGHLDLHLSQDGMVV